MSRLKRIFEVRAYGGPSRRALKAASYGDFKTALHYIDAGGNANFKGTIYYDILDGTGALADGAFRKSNMGYCAIDARNDQALGALLERGLDPNSHVKEEGMPLLAYALQNGRTEAAKSLIAAGANCDFQFPDLRTLADVAHEQDEALARDIAQRLTQASTKVATPKL